MGFFTDMLLEELANNSSQTATGPEIIPPKTLTPGASVKRDNTPKHEPVVNIHYQTNLFRFSFLLQSI